MFDLVLWEKLISLSYLNSSWTNSDRISQQNNNGSIKRLQTMLHNFHWKCTEILFPEKKNAKRLANHRCCNVITRRFGYLHELGYAIAQLRRSKTIFVISIRSYRLIIAKTRGNNYSNVAQWPQIIVTLALDKQI